ncbi:hypothetical protein [Saccharomonospora cyanea]|uniref:Clumping factor A n=1 Tax=Saccharomonospora cyanea NA-134 TaxID=882082 RepID=H5XDV5_9PSEU|nr:hypothetical protein [Saccharomonospora cyanea]EHR62435.1 hypothetical protein SaccyDRAFT_3607 [Saccharomonospora cyanea NA-134]
MLYIVLLLVLVALGLVVAALVTASSLWAWVSIGASGLAGALLLVDRLRRRSRNPAGASATTRDPADIGNDRVTADAGDGEATGAHEPADVSGPPETSESTKAVEASGNVEAVTAADAGPGFVADESAGDGAASGGAADAADKGSREPVPTLVATAVPGSDEQSGVPAREPVAANGLDPLTDTAPRTALLASSGELAGADVDPPEEDTEVDDALLVSELESEVLVVDEYPRYHLGHCAWLGTRATIPLAVKEARDLGFTPCGLCGPDAELAAAHRRRRVPRRNTA